MLLNIRIFLWSIVAELEYHLYPWKDKNPPDDVIQKYKLPETNYDNNLQYDWLKAHDEKIGRLQTEMIWVQNEIHKLNIELKTHE